MTLSTCSASLARQGKAWLPDMRGLVTGATPDSLDHAFMWQLQDVLQAIDAIAPVDSIGHPPTQVRHCSQPTPLQ